MTSPLRDVEPPQAQGLTVAQLAALLALVQAQAAVRQRMTSAAVQGALALLRPFTGWWSDQQVRDLSTRMLRVVQPAQRQAAAVTDAYLTRASQTITGRRFTPAGPVDVRRLRTDIDRDVARLLVNGEVSAPWVELGDLAAGPSRDIDAPAPMVIRTRGQTASRTATAAPRATTTAPRATTTAPRANTTAPRTTTPRTTATAAARRQTTAADLLAPDPGARIGLGELLPPQPAPQRTAGARIPTPLPPARPPRQAPMRTIDPAEPYIRIAEQYRYQVTAEGVPEDKARRRALVKLEILAQTDVTLAIREQYHRTMGAHRATGYRRILHPELSQSGPCGLCVVAADRTYHVADLLPLHTRCVCEVLPIYDRSDPGIFLNRSDLDRLYRAAAGDEEGRDFNTSRRALSNIRVALTENGEIGPVLVNADQHYRGPAEVALTKVADQATRLRGQLAQLERSYETLQHRALRGENLRKSLDWQRGRIAEIRRELGEAGEQLLDTTAAAPPARAGVAGR